MTTSNAIRSHKTFMRILAAIYLLVGLLFFFLPRQTIELINVIPNVFHVFDPIPVPAEQFWSVLATSMMAMLVVTSLYSSFYPHIKGFFVLHLTSKAVSVVGFMYAFLFINPYFGYLLGIFTDSLIFILVFFSLLRVLPQKTLYAQR